MIARVWDYNTQRWLGEVYLPEAIIEKFEPITNCIIMVSTSYLPLDFTTPYEDILHTEKYLPLTWLKQHYSKKYPKLFDEINILRMKDAL